MQHTGGQWATKDPQKINCGDLSIVVSKAIQGAVVYSCSKKIPTL